MVGGRGRAEVDSGTSEMREGRNLRGQYKEMGWGKRKYAKGGREKRRKEGNLEK